MERHTDRVDVEHRRAPRFEIQVPLIIEWLDEAGTKRQETGFTRNMSKGGLFALCDGESPACHTEISMAFYFPPIGPNTQPWRMQSVGHVLRIDDSSRTRAFASTLEDLGVTILEDGPAWFRVQ